MSAINKKILTSFNLSDIISKIERKEEKARVEKSDHSHGFDSGNAWIKRLRQQGDGI